MQYEIVLLLFAYGVGFLSIAFLHIQNCFFFLYIVKYGDPMHTQLFFSI